MYVCVSHYKSTSLCGCDWCIRAHTDTLVWRISYIVMCMAFFFFFFYFSPNRLCFFGTHFHLSFLHKLMQAHTYSSVCELINRVEFCYQKCINRSDRHWNQHDDSNKPCGGEIYLLKTVQFQCMHYAIFISCQMTWFPKNQTHWISL